jgi:hypothetical protein
MNVDLKGNVIRVICDYLAEKGFDDFHSHLDEMKDPAKIVQDSTGKIFTPDLTARNEDGKYIFETELDIPENKEHFIQKCRIFEAAALKNNGKLYLIVPIENFDSILQMVNLNKLENIGIIKIDIGNN